MNNPKEFGLKINLKGSAPSTDKVRDIFRDFQSVELHPRRQFVINSLGTTQKEHDIDFDVTITIWEPFGNEIANHILQDVDFLLSYNYVKMTAKTVIGLRDSAGEIKEVE